jgi:hypothetical protein
MDYVLQYSLDNEDIDFLNATTIAFEIFDPVEEINGNDSGWCDMATGARIISDTHRVVFKDVSPEQLTFLTLKYYTRLKPLHNGFKKIYKYKTDIQ